MAKDGKPVKPYLTGPVTDSYWNQVVYNLAPALPTHFNKFARSMTQGYNLGRNNLFRDTNITIAVYDFAAHLGEDYRNYAGFMFVNTLSGRPEKFHANATTVDKVAFKLTAIHEDKHRRHAYQFPETNSPFSTAPMDYVMFEKTRENAAVVEEDIKLVTDVATNIIDPTKLGPDELMPIGHHFYTFLDAYTGQAPGTTTHMEQARAALIAIAEKADLRDVTEALPRFYYECSFNTALQNVATDHAIARSEKALAKLDERDPRALMIYAEQGASFQKVKFNEDYLRGMLKYNGVDIMNKLPKREFQAFMQQQGKVSAVQYQRIHNAAAGFSPYIQHLRA